jgi:two-component system, OmpR family, response regulator ArlR
MARKKKSLLIVDDEINVTRTLQMVFEDEGYSVTPAYSCAEALKLMQNGHQYDGVITDLNMEHDDIGLTVARRALDLKPQPVVIICTGFANMTNARQALLMHVHYLATKPVELDELKSNLRRLISIKDSGQKAGR